jgi:ABC-2 type transport system permease protein
VGALLLVALFATGFSGLALALASQSRSIAGYHGIIFLFNLPMLFASNALYPLEELPGWMSIIVMCNPTTYLISAVRVLAFGAESTISLPLSIGVQVLFGVVGVALALMSFQVSLRNQ